MLKQNQRKQELERILNGDLQLTKDLTKQVLAYLGKMRKKHPMSDDLIKDVTQSALTEFIWNVRNNKFNYESSIAVYVIAIAKRMAMRQISEEGRYNDFGEVSLIDMIPEEDFLDEDSGFEGKWKAFLEEYKTMGKECRELIRKLYKGISYAEITKQGGYAEGYVWLKVHRCKKELLKRIKENEIYKNL